MKVRSILGILAICAAGIDIAETPPVQIERDHGRMCLALAAFAEARSEGDAGMAAVMRVVLNRTTDPGERWPDSICGVVQQPGQFIGVEGWKYPRHPDLNDYASWQRALDLADSVIDGTGPALGVCSTATSFDRGGSEAILQPVCRLGAHVFYTEATRVAAK